MKPNTLNLPLNQILQGDSLELLKTIPSQSIDLIFADPPYWMRVEGALKRPNGGDFSGCDDLWDNQFATNSDYSDFTRAWLTQCRRILKPNGSIWVIGAMQCIYTIGGIMQDLDFWFINDIVWHKSNPTPNFLGTRLNNAHETLIWATKNKKSTYTFHYKTAKELNSDNVAPSEFSKGARKQLGSVWKMPVCSGTERLKNARGEKLHSTQKPESLLYRIIAISSNMGDVVLDPFGGSMTTAAMAKRLGRSYIMLEQNSAYIKAGQKRVNGVAFENSDIARAKFDEKVPKVSLCDLIDGGLLRVGQRLYMGESSAILNANGKVEFEGAIYDIHALCANLKGTKAKRLNGFLHWEVESGGLESSGRENGRISLDELRKIYRKRHL